MTDEHFRYMDSRSIRDFDEEPHAQAAYWLAVPADGNDAEVLVQLLQAADEWAAGDDDRPPVYDRVHAEQVHALLASIRRSFDAHAS